MRFLPCVLLVACATDAPTPEETASIRFVLAPDGSLPAPLDVPFPSDLYRGDDGLLPASFGPWDRFGLTKRHDTIASGLAGLDGFGRSVGAVFLLDDAHPIDPRTLIDAESFAIVDTTPGSERLIQSSAFFTEELSTLVVQPDRVVLDAGRTYAVVIGTAVRTTDGRRLTPPPDLVAALDSDGIYATALPALESVGFARGEIASLAVFTTQTRHALLHRARAKLVDGAWGTPVFRTDSTRFPTARFGVSAHEGWTATLDEWLGEAPRGEDGEELPGFPSLDLEAGVGTAHDAIGAVVSGTFTSPELRRPFVSTASPDDGTIALDASGDPIAVDLDNEVPLTIILPRGPAPARGFPVVLFGHGTPTHRSYALSVANELAAAGFAVLSLDAPEHGMRAPGALDERSSFTGPFEGPDAMADDIQYLSSTIAAFGDLVNLARARDTRAQTVVDYLALVRLVEAGVDLSSVAGEYGGVAPALDASFIGWVGVSFGGINGIVLAAVEPAIDAFVLDVGGGLEFVTFGGAPANLPQVDLFLPLFGASGSRDVRMSRFHPVLTLLQTMLDSTDPASFAREAAGSSTPIYMIAVDHDELVPNYGTEVVALEMGLSSLAASPIRIAGMTAIDAPARGANARALLVQTLGTHGRNLTSRLGVRRAETPFPREDRPRSERIVFLPEPVTVRQPIVATQRSMVGFLESAREGEATIDVSGIELWFDFDDDGFSDDEERAAGTSPFDPALHPSGAPTHVRDVGF